MNTKFTDRKLQGIKPIVTWTTSIFYFEGYLKLKTLKTDSLPFIEIDVSFA